MLPGVTEDKVPALAARAGTLANLAAMPLDVLVEVLGRPNATKLFKFMHAEAPV